MRACTKCHIEKPITEFYKAARYKDGHQRWCKSCVCASSNAARKKRAHHNTPEYQRANQLWTKHRLRVEDFDRLNEAQGGLCAICHRPETVKDRSGNDRFLSVDHDHGCCSGKRGCGKCVRGLLCARCNSAIGLLGDDTARLRSAIRYLES